MAQYALSPAFLPTGSTPASAPINHNQTGHLKGQMVVFPFELNVGTQIANGRIPATGLVTNDTVIVNTLPGGFKILGGFIEVATAASAGVSAATVDLVIQDEDDVDNPGDIVTALNAAATGTDLISDSSTLHYQRTVGDGARGFDSTAATFRNHGYLKLRYEGVTGANVTNGVIRGHIFGMTE